MIEDPGYAAKDMIGPGFERALRLLDAGDADALAAADGGPGEPDEAGEAPAFWTAVFSPCERIFFQKDPA